MRSACFFGFFCLSILLFSSNARSEVNISTMTIPEYLAFYAFEKTAIVDKIVTSARKGEVDVIVECSRGREIRSIKNEFHEYIKNHPGVTDCNLAAAFTAAMMDCSGR